MNKYNRRLFLKNTSTLGLSSLLFSSISQIPMQLMAEALEEKSKKINFVLFKVVGGMDTLLGLHPWTQPTSLPEEELFLTYNPSVDVLKNINNTQISLGYSAHDLAPFAGDMKVIRGIVMGASDIGHPSALQHISSGKTVDTAPHVSTIMAQALNTSDNFFITNSIVQKSPKQTYSTFLTTELGNIQIADMLDEDEIRLLTDYKKQHVALASFLKLLKQKSKLESFYRILNEVNSQRSKNNMSVDGYYSGTQNKLEVLPENLVLASIASEFTKVAQIDLVDESKNLDTHGNHYLHKEFQKYRWQRIANFLTNLKKYNLWNNTVVMVVSEFNRSPGKNNMSGKDHNVNDNAVALFGGPVSGGSSLGDHQLYLGKETMSTSLWTGSYLNYKTGAVEDVSSLHLANGSSTEKISDKLPEHVDLIRPENVWASVLNYIDPKLAKNFSTTNNYLPGLFKV